jgi:hypothetical protein
MKKYHFIYKTTNTINGKIYVGVHSTNNLKDGYIGCGIYRDSDAVHKSKKTRFYGFSKAVVKYGYSNFKREIMYFFKTKEEAYYFESKIVNNDFIESNDNYNIKIGGITAPIALGIKRSREFKKQKSEEIYKYMNKLVDIHSKEFVVLDTSNNKIYHIKNLSEFCRKNNLSETGLRSVYLSRSRLYKKRWYVCKKENWKSGFEYTKKSNDPIVGMLYHKDGSMVSFNSLREASELTGQDRSMLSKVIRGKVSHSGGWSCKAW